MVPASSRTDTCTGIGAVAPTARVLNAVSPASTAFSTSSPGSTAIFNSGLLRHLDQQLARVAAGEQHVERAERVLDALHDGGVVLDLALHHPRRHLRDELAEAVEIVDDDEAFDPRALHQ